MDCEKFDRVVLDLLYDELDELTRAAARRHMEHCARCGPIANGLRATREVGVIPLEAPPPDLERRILEAERRARARLPWRQRVGRAVSVVAGYAMRPQLGMVALLLLMIGSSLLVLRSHPSERDEARVKETGVPEIEGETPPAAVALQQPRPGPAALSEEGPPTASLAREERKAELGSSEPSSAALGALRPAARAGDLPKKASGADLGDSYDQAVTAYRSGDYAEAQRRFAAIASAEGPNAPSAALQAAQATRDGSGCAAATPRFEEVAQRYAGSSIGYDAAWQAADCYRDLGQEQRAERAYRALLRAPGYERRAADALARLTDQPVAVAKSRARVTSKAASAPPPAAPAKQQTKPAARAVESSNQARE